MTSVRAREAFDLSKEPPKVRERYGMTRFGQSCLLARRLVEAGVRFVTLNTFITVFDEITWDIHGSKPFTSIEGMRDIVAPMYDQGYSALLEDLFQRGMLDTTLVTCLAEFGRTPKVNPAGGRDHWPNCWTVNFAGGGVKGGRIVGKSDEIGGYPVERPVSLPRSWPRFITAWAWTWKRTCRVRNPVLSRWWILGPSLFGSCFENGQLWIHPAFQACRTRTEREPSSARSGNQRVGRTS